MLIFSYQLVNPAGDHDNHNGADRRSHNDWQQLRLYDIEVEHKRHAWRNKEESKILDQKIRYTLNPSEAYPFKLQARCEQQHPDDAGRQGEGQHPLNTGADPSDAEDDADLR